MKSHLSLLLRSMPMRLALGLVVLFSIVSLLGLGANYVLTARSLDQAMRDDLNQDMAGFLAVPSEQALAALVEAEAAATDPARLVLSYVTADGRNFGNTRIARDEDGYHLVSLAEGNVRIDGTYLAYTATLWGGQLTVARNRNEFDALRAVFLQILGLSLVPTVLIALSGGLYLAAHSAGQMARIADTLDQLTTGHLDARVEPDPKWSQDLLWIGRKVDEMARSQQVSVTALQQVSSDIAHDLKTPIQRVAVHLDELSRQGNLVPRDQDILDKATREVEGITAIFRSLLQITQIDSGRSKAQFREVDLGGLCATFCEIYEPTAADNGQVLTYEVAQGDPCLVKGDKTLLGQVLANLIENALHHTEKGARVEVAVTHRTGSVILSVSDDGPGIPEGERALVLRRLYRLDRSRSTPGNGLGLSLVASITAFHDAELRLFDNAPGLRVEIAFPRAS